jgi:sugar phosphate isomerase/epimerase
MTFTSAFEPPLVQELAALGIEAVEPFHTVFVQDPASVSRCRSMLSDHGMRVSAVDVLCDLAGGTAEEKRKGREELRRGLDICAALGAEVAHVAGHSPKEGISLTDARRRIADELSREAGFAQKHGLTLAIEDFGFTPTLLCKAADCLETLQFARGAVRFVFDAGNFEFAGEHADANLDELYEHICYVHIKDLRPASDRRPGDVDFGLPLVGCPLGEGIVPGRRIAQMLKKRRYAGWIALECAFQPGQFLSAVQRDLPTLRRWME